MIRLRPYNNTSCLKCGVVNKEMVMIGAIVMCKKCTKDEFGIETSLDNGIKVGGKLYEIYKDWLKVYYEVNK